MKYFRMSYEEVVFRRSYLNILLLNRSIPSYKWNDDEDEKKGSEKTHWNKRGSVAKSKEKFRNETELFMSLM